MPKFSEIVDREVFRRCGVDVEPLRSWWRSPIADDFTAESLLTDSFADSFLGDGTRHCIEAPEARGALRELGMRWLKSAAGVVQGGSCSDLETAPLWLSWLQQTCEAFDLWRRSAAEYASHCNREALLNGAEFIRAGLPALALSYWKRLRRAARHYGRRERILSQRTEVMLKQARQDAEITGVSAPSAEGLEASEALTALVQWHQELRNSKIHDLFWLCQLEFLRRIRNTDPNPDIAPLIRSAKKRSPVTPATLYKLIQANRNVTDRLLHRIKTAELNRVGP